MKLHGKNVKNIYKLNLMRNIILLKSYDKINGSQVSYWDSFFRLKWYVYLVVCCVISMSHLVVLWFVWFRIFILRLQFKTMDYWQTDIFLNSLIIWQVMTSAASCRLSSLLAIAFGDELNNWKPLFPM